VKRLRKTTFRLLAAAILITGAGCVAGGHRPLAPVTGPEIDLGEASRAGSGQDQQPRAAGKPTTADERRQPVEYIMRGQSYGDSMEYESAGPGDYRRGPMPPSGANGSQPAGGASSIFGPPPVGSQGQAGGVAPATSGGAENGRVKPVQYGAGGVGPLYQQPGIVTPTEPPVSIEGMVSAQPPDLFADTELLVNETQTGRFMFGVGVNSDAGVTGSILVDERNFDIHRFPRRLRDLYDGTAFRGAGQSFRFEALPGSEVQRYSLRFTEPYLWDTPVSFSVSAFYYQRQFTDWDEERAGGRLSLGYRLTPNLSLSASVRASRINISDPSDPSVTELADVVGKNELYAGGLTLTHDTRDFPFLPSDGHLLEFTVEQVFGTFDYTRAEVDFRRYFLLSQRIDGSGKHTLGFRFRTGVTGGQTPIYENFFAGGFSTLRGFDFRGASPKVKDVIVGGEFLFLGSAEYTFPVSGDDMLRGVLFCDFGTVEEQVELSSDTYRVAIGAGLRITVPALGPAPIALDFAVPVSRADTDDNELFSFFIGALR